MKKPFLFTLFCLIILTNLFFSFSIVKAEDVSFDNPVPVLAGKSVESIVGLVIKGLLGVLGAAALCIFIYAGFIWMFAQGNSTKIKHAVDIMKYCVLGMLVIFSSYVLLKFVFDIVK